MELLDNINMQSEKVEFKGLLFKVDSFATKSGVKSILPILLEEQPTTWDILSNELSNENTNIKVLDVGTGSGFWAIMIKSKFPNFDVFAIDKNDKAIEIANYNANQNNTQIQFRHSNYTSQCYSSNFFDYIILTPPYHIYHPVLEKNIPFFARGGIHGQQEFKNQLITANNHLKETGKILFNMMCLGSENKPEFCNYIPEIFDFKVNLKYFNIFPKIKSSLFIDKMYPKEYSEFKNEITSNYSHLFYTCGIISRDKSVKIIEKESPVAVKNRTWQDRFNLHLEINIF